MKILVDLDETVVNLLDPWLERYNNTYDDDLTRDEITSWDAHTFTKPECGTKFYNLIETPGFFRHLKPYPGAVEALHTLSARHDVYIATAGPGGDTGAQDKINWCGDYLGIDRRKVFIGHHKEMVKADVFIDDSPRNIKKYRAAWPEAAIMAMAQPYNKEVDDLCLLFPSWKTPVKAWESIVMAVNVVERIRR